jgi:hypothetical protein
MEHQMSGGNWKMVLYLLKAINFGLVILVVLLKLLSEGVEGLGIVLAHGLLGLQRGGLSNDALD